MARRGANIYSNHMLVVIKLRGKVRRQRARHPNFSKSFETRQGLRQGDVLSSLFFNEVLKFIVRRANLKTTGTIYNKETQLLAYADDIDIVSRSQSAVRNVYLALEREASKVG
jgi:hypothetical protein